MQLLRNSGEFAFVFCVYTIFPRIVMITAAIFFFPERELECFTLDLDKFHQFCFNCATPQPGMVTLSFTTKTVLVRMLESRYNASVNLLLCV